MCKFCRLQITTLLTASVTWWKDCKLLVLSEKLSTKSILLYNSVDFEFFNPQLLFLNRNSNSVYYTGSLLAFRLSRDLNSSLNPKLNLNTKSSVKPMLRLTLVLELGLKLSFGGKDRLETQFKTEFKTPAPDH